ncbi:cell division protein FtsH [bacterium (Candidatus Gribaldobacteria) CG_4_10_14_0_8_um_filter_33_9]|uniref:ATP-dependent zinc metalloprotease FtsH n=1 Tax=bacterium (Candidatus Gribaldobacteria) CG_4_10_14_0_8_um_filter_33_9 TaxID=2014266 RepID=A0A2M7RNZ0_9BACT|nr:MAG: cell division protein FtsH [bacterium (Candidatus Gribaldobacteria) CG_4_10_14_0_8_um_filter_33_9]
MKKILQNFLFVILFFLIISGIFALFAPDQKALLKEISFSKFVQDIKEGKIKQIKVSQNEISIIYKSGEKTSTRKETGVSIFESLNNYGLEKEKIAAVEDIKIEKEKESVASWLIPLLFFILPLLIFGWFFWSIFRQAKTGASQTFGFLRAPAKLFGGEKTDSEKIFFKDIAGIEQAKEGIKEIVDFLKSPEKFLKMGARIPRGVLLVGPPGVGKTMLARAVSNEAKVPFFSIAGSAFIELFVGVGSSRVRNLFEMAKKNQPSIVFIDELDAIGKTRMPGIGGGHEEREQTLNQILSEMDGFERDTGVIVMGATNKPEHLDSALLRPGRFDRLIVLDLPDIKERQGILEIHCQGKPLATDVNLMEISERTPGFSGADLANLVNESAILAARRDKTQIEQKELLESIEKVLLGPERKSHLLTDKEKKITAFHEAGHALIAHFIPGTEKVGKVSIVARGMAAGYTLILPKKEKQMKTKSEFLTDLSILLGGFCAENLIFKETSTGAANDLEKASIVARNLVVKYGMSKLGPIVFGKRNTLSFLEMETETEKNYSEKIAELIDKETERFIKQAEGKTLKILKEKKNILEKIAKVLMEKETIEKQEFEKLVKKGA